MTVSFKDLGYNREMVIMAKLDVWIS